LLFGEPFLEGTGVTEILKNNRKISNMNQGYQILKKALDNPSETKIPKDALNLLQKLLEIDPHKRITAAEALYHPYFTPIPCGMQRVPSSDGFVKLALSKYNQNTSSPLFSSPLKNSSGSPLSNRSPFSSGSPDKLSNTPLHRYAEKDSLYLDMGRPEMNGKIDTLTSGSMNNSLLMLTRDNSHGNNSAAGSLSNFAKGKGGMEIKGHTKSFKNGLVNHQSVLKAAIFRNMRNKSEVPLADLQQEQEQPARDVRRGSIENHLKIQVDTRRSTFMSESPSEKSKDGDRQGDLSSSPEYEQNIIDKENAHMNKLPQINSQKRYQPFTQR
jgi:serine/threonine protein kinase